MLIQMVENIKALQSKASPNPLDHRTIGFIGGGNMASAIIGGLLSTGFTPSHITASALSSSTLSKLASMGIKTNSNQGVCDADIIILAVKPQVLKTVCGEIKEFVGTSLVVSIAAGIQLGDIEKWLMVEGQKPSVVRVMPNTPALVSQGATGMIWFTVRYIRVYKVTFVLT